MASDLSNDFRPGDNDNNLLRKILNRLMTLVGVVQDNVPHVIIDPGDIEIGAVEIKNSTTDDRVQVQDSAPAAGAYGMVVRNIPSGTQTVSVSNFPATQPVSGTVAVSNFPAVQTVSGTVAISNFPADSWDPLFSASRLGTVLSKAAKVFHVLGRRAGFAASSGILQDVAEFLALTTDAMPELTGVESLELVSSSASDTAAGTGARTIRVTYLNTSNAMVTSTDIALNGVTAVPAGFNAKFIYSMETSTVGSNVVSVGNVLLRIAGAGATQEQITAGGNRSLSCRFMVPTGFKGYIPSWQITALGAATQDVRLRATVHSDDRSLGTTYIFQDNAFLDGSNGASVAADIPWLAFPALCKIKVSTIPGATGASNRIDSDITILLIAD